MRRNLEELFKINDRFCKNFKHIIESYKLNIDYVDSDDCDIDFDNLIESVDGIEIKYIQYSKITSLMYTLDDYILDDFIDFFNRKVREKEIKDMIKYKKVDIFFKIISHIELSAIQKRNLYYNQQDTINELNFEISSISEKNIELDKKHSKIEELYKNIMVSFVSILGIFASIIFAVFGGFKQLESLGSSLSEIPVYKMFLYIGVTGIVLNSVIFVSFYSISKLTGLTLRSCDCGKKCECSILKKYPVLILNYGLLMLMVYIGFVLLILTEYYDLGITSYRFIGYLFVFCPIIIVIIGIICFFIKNIYQRKIKKEN